MGQVCATAPDRPGPSLQALLDPDEARARQQEVVECYQQ
jgi:hypothetical protein